MSKLNSVRFSMSHNDCKSRFNSIQSRIHQCFKFFLLTQDTHFEAIIPVHSLQNKQSGFLREVWKQRRRPNTSIHQTKQKQISPLQSSDPFLVLPASRLPAADPPSLALSWQRCWSSFLVSSLSSVWPWLKWASMGPVSRPLSELSRICCLWTLKIRICLCSLLLATGHYPQSFGTDKQWNAVKDFFQTDILLLDHWLYVKLDNMRGPQNKSQNTPAHQLIALSWWAAE